MGARALGGSPGSWSEQPGYRSRAVLCAAKRSATQQIAGRERCPSGPTVDMCRATDHGMPTRCFMPPFARAQDRPQRRPPATCRLMAATGRVGPPCALTGGEVTVTQPGH